jgi:hypothetical protein
MCTRCSLTANPPRKNHGPKNSGFTTCALTCIFTFKKNTLKRTDLDDFVKCYNPKNRRDRKEGERFKSFTYEELTKRDKLNLDIF